MKQLLTNLLMCGLAAGATGASLDARVKVSGRSLSGTLEKRGPGFVIFHPKGSSAAGRIPDNQLEYITFKAGDELSAAGQQFDTGAFREAADTYNRILPSVLPYFGLPSNLSDDFPRWMIASYRVGEYNRTIELAKTLASVSEEPVRISADFYSRLARLEQGEYEAMIAFMKTSEAAALYPENSAVRLYIQARLLQHEDRPLEAIRTITGLIARHGRDADWMPKAELLCAELYFELDMPESAQAVLEDIRDFYSDEDIQKKAAALAAKQQ